MKNIQKTIEQVSALLIKESVTYPQRLLAKHNLKNDFDVENLRYLTQGGEAGGYFQWLTLLAKHSDAKLIVELGNRYGSSTIALYHGLKKDQTLVTIDTEKDQRYVPQEIFDDKRIKFVWGDCIQLNSYAKAKLPVPIDIDVLWSDTIHFDEQISAEFYVYEPLLADEALIVIDDIRLNDKGKFFARMQFWKKDLANICHANGFGVIHYVRPKGERGRSVNDRILEATMRSSKVFEKRWHAYHDSKVKLKERLQEINKDSRHNKIKNILGKRLVRVLNNVRFGRY